MKDFDNILDSLDEDKKRILEHFKEICNDLDVNECVLLLSESDWDLERAVNQHLLAGNSSLPPIHDHEMHQSAASYSSQASSASPLSYPNPDEWESMSTHIANSVNAVHRSPPGVRLARNVRPTAITNNGVGLLQRAFPHVVLNSPHLQVLRNYRSMSTWQWTAYILLAPVQYAYVSLREIFLFLVSLIWRRNRRPQLTDPVLEVSKFVDSFQQKFLPSSAASFDSPSDFFYRQSYADAVAAAKSELKFLLVYLHSDTETNSEAFCREVMCHPLFLEFLQRNCERHILWACNVQSSEGQRVSQALCCQEFPFVGVLVLRNSRGLSGAGGGVQMTLVARVEGYDPKGDPVAVDGAVALMLAQLEAVIQDNGDDIGRLAREQEERMAAQRLRAEQDQEYLASMQADAARFAAKDRALDEERQRAQKEAQQRDLLVKARAAVRNSVPSNVQFHLVNSTSSAKGSMGPGRVLPPTVDGSADVVQICARMPDGARLECVFPRTSSTKYLFLSVFSLDTAPASVTIYTNFPKRRIPCSLTCLMPPLAPDLDVEARNFWAPSDDDPPTFAALDFARKEMVLVMDEDA